MTLAFTFPGARGGLLHSGTALLPFLLPAAAVGLDAAVEAAALRLRHWKPEKSKPMFALLTLFIVVCAAALLFMERVIGPDWRRPRWPERDAVYAAAGAWLRSADGPEAMAAVNNPPGWYYYAELPSLVIPNGGVETLLQAMADHGARWLVLDADRPMALAELYADPESSERFALRVTLADAAGRPIYLLERLSAP
jgi:hypothetical protein